MKEARYFYVPNASQVQELPQEEATHALRVLRLKEGDELFLMDGQGSFFRATVTLSNNHHCCYAIEEALPQQPAWRAPIHLAIAPTKMVDRIEWMVEKAVEVGIDEISFLDCQFSERRSIRTDRIEKIVVSAMKQSRKAWLPRVNALKPFRHFVQEERPGLKFIAHCYDEIPRVDLFDTLQAIGQPSPVTILVGPEGDFSVDEVRDALSHGYQSVTLGSSRLRTETAGLYAVTTAQLILRHGPS